MNNGEFAQQFRREEKVWNSLKNLAEQKLGEDIASGKVKVGSVAWREQCENIELFDRMASDLNTRYNEND
jgi:hypothetical protein